MCQEGADWIPPCSNTFHQFLGPETISSCGRYEQIPGLAFAAIGFGNHNILLSRAALLMPLVLAAVQQTQPDSPEFLAQRLWEDKGIMDAVFCWFASPLVPPCPLENSGGLKIAVDAPRNSWSISTCFEHHLG